MIEQLHASAGSGKTYRLTRRFVSLLMASGRASQACGEAPGQEYGPEGILAITFTNKASAEMKVRVLKALKNLALGQPDDDHQDPASRARATALLERSLRHFQTLNIRTIDSLLNQLARLFALELGLPPDFETSLDQDAVFEDLHDALTASMTGPEAAPQTQDLVRSMSTALIAVEGATGFWLGQRVTDRLRQAFDFLLDREAPEVPDMAQAKREYDALLLGLNHAARTMRDALTLIGAAPVSNFENFLETARNVPSLRKLPSSTYASKPSVADCLPRGSKHLASPELENLYDALRQAYAQASTRGEALAKAIAWQPFLAFAHLLVRDFERLRRDKGLALLSQMPSSVARLMEESGGVSEAFCRLGARLTHLLIDEFQDTSLAQWSVLSQLALECLSKGGSLFYVGDVKQAIYGWRGGQAELFEAAARQPDLARICREPRVETLDRNWRSAPRIVEFNNRVFSGLEREDVRRTVRDALLPEGSETSRAWLEERLAASFRHVSQKTKVGLDPSHGLVSIQTLPGETKDDHQESVRQALCLLITQHLDKRRKPGEIAVLTRTNKEASLAARWLTDAGVPVVTENSLLLASHPLVRGAVSFLAFLDYPPDNLALWGFLSCRELFGRSQCIPQRALTDWLASQPKGQPLYRRFRADFPEAWDRLVDPFLKAAGPASPYDLTHELFTACRVFEALPEDEVFARRFLELTHNAETQGYGSLSAFLEFWREKGGQEKIPQPEEAQAVRVMTIHKAKGLEFPVAVVPFVQYTFRGPEGLADVGGGFAAPLGPRMGEAYHGRVAQTLLEQVNLLYVAWTRPMEELHVFLPASRKLVNGSPLTKAAEILLEASGVRAPGQDACLGASPPSQAELVASATPQPAARQETFVCDDSGLSGPLAAAPLLEWLPGLKIARPGLEDPQERLRLSERKRGEVLHKALELMRPEDEAAQAVDRAMVALGHRGPEADRTAESLTDAVAWLQGQDFFPQCLHLGLREAELLDEDATVHRPDLLAFTPTQTLVLDYKTGGEDPAHHQQVRRYLRLVQALPQAGGLPVRGLVVYLDRRVARDVLPERDA